VVFDMAGTTVYDGDAVHHCLQAALAGAGGSATREEINAGMGIAKPLAIRRILEKQSAEQPLSEEAIDPIYARFLKRMLVYYREDPSVREVEGAATVFQYLHTAGVRIGLDTGFSRPIADAILERLGWQREGWIDATVTSDEVQRGRPYPDMIFRLMDLTDVADSARVVKVGDTPSDLQQGDAAGCAYVIGVTEGSHTRSELELHPHTHLIPTIAGLPEILR